MLKIDFSKETAAGFTSAETFFKERGVSLSDSFYQPGDELRCPVYPFADNEISYVRMNLVLDRFTADAEFLRIMKELYRICADGAILEITTLEKVFAEAMHMPFPMRSVSAERLSVLSSDHGICNFKQISESLNLSDAYIAAHKDQSLNRDTVIRDIHNDPTTVKSRTFLLYAEKSDGRYPAACVRIGDIQPFMFRVYNPENKSRYLSRALLQFGIWEGGESLLFIKTVRAFAEKFAAANRDVKVLNIGANLGWYSLLSVKAADNVKVTAFEPAPENFELLKRNVALNECADKISCIQTALSDKEGEVDFYVYDDNDGGNSLMRRSENDTVVRVKAGTLSSFCTDTEPHDFAHIVIIDVEGHEQPAFEGALSLFEQGFRPVIFAEFSPSLMKQRGKCDWYTKLIELYGYNAYCILNSDELIKESALHPVSAEELKQNYERLKDDSEGRYMNLMFAPSFYDPISNSFKV